MRIAGAHSRFSTADSTVQALRRTRRIQTLEPRPWLLEVERRGHGTRLSEDMQHKEMLATCVCVCDMLIAYLNILIVYIYV